MRYCGLGPEASPGTFLEGVHTMRRLMLVLVLIGLAAGCSSTAAVSTSTSYQLEPGAAVHAEIETLEMFDAGVVPPEAP